MALLLRSVAKKELVGIDNILGSIGDAAAAKKAPVAKKELVGMDNILGSIGDAAAAERKGEKMGEG